VKRFRPCPPPLLRELIVFSFIVFPILFGFLPCKYRLGMILTLTGSFWKAKLLKGFKMNLKEHSTTRLLALFFVSIALIAYELYVIRVFSIGSWYNFGSLIISTALLGVGLSGTLLTFLQKWIKKRPLTWLFVLACAAPAHHGPGAHFRPDHPL
jgi:hypothetical protein